LQQDPLLQTPYVLLTPWFDLHGEYTMKKRAYKDTEAAYYTGYSRHYLRECRNGRLGPGPKYIKIGRTVRYLQEDLDDWLDSFKQSGGNAA
jgi:predicted DNA-binding transcriptional regulator AlpA